MAEIQVSKEPQGEQQSRAVSQRRQGRRGLPSLLPVSAREMLSLSPFELMHRMTEEMDRFFEGTWPSSARAETRLWSPPIEVAEKPGAIIISADLPGLRKEDVKVELTTEGLSIGGQRRRQREDEQEGLYRSEISYGSFSRLIPLPEEAQTDKATARFDNGVLTVTVPIPEQQQRRRQIPIEGEGSQSPPATGGSRTAA